MKIGTDFSGIGSPEQALKNLGIKHSVEFSCEIDKHARESYLANHDTKKMYEDITKRNHSEVDQLDLYIAGFPCQAFSISGKRQGFDDVRGTLFFNVAEFIKINQPQSFILENVKGLLSHEKGRTFQTIIDLLSNGGGTVNSQISLDILEDGLGYHIYYKVLNTKEHGIPQNRERIFIIGFKDFRDYQFPSPEPLKLKLKDILEEEVDQKYFLSDKMLNSISKWKSQQNPLDKIFTGEDIMSCVLARGDGEIHAGMKLLKVHSLHPRSSKTGKGGTGHLTKQDGTTYCLDTGNCQAVEIADYRNDEGLRIRKDKTSPCLAATKNSETELSRMPPVIITNKIRRLTPLECFRLQGFPDSFKKVVSDTQLYKQAGNSITVNVIQKVIKNILNK